MTDMLLDYKENNITVSEYRDSYLYVAHFPHGKMTKQTFEEALEYAQKNDGYCVQAKGKNLFPDYLTIWADLKPQNRYWFIINLKEV